jgi:glycerol-3-phosphate acyltransferase PlsX
VIGAPVALGAALVPAVLKLRKSLDYRAYGGVPLLGVNGVAIIAHGKSDAAAITSALRRAKESVDRGLITQIEQLGLEQ